MWEAIARNRFRSRLLILVMGLVLVGLGFAVGMAVEPNGGGLIGGLAAVGLWLVLALAAIYEGDSILLGTVGAREIQKEDAPQLWNVVEEMTIASGLGRIPRVYIIEDDAPNAFAAGRKPEKAVVAVTSGLLKRLKRDELQGVVAHEIGHIRNQDIRFMTLAAVMLGAIVIISDVFLRSLYYGGGRMRSRSSGRSKGGNQAEAVIMIVALLFAILAPLFAKLLYLASSRRREYLADASAARFTRYPEGLASALEKISRSAGSVSMKKASRVVAPLYTVNPREGRSFAGLFSTHPPASKRIAILRGMAGNAGYKEYEAAFRKIEGKKGGLIGGRTLGEAESVPIREASAETGTALDEAREVSELLGRLGDYVVLRCACGLGLQIPPGFGKHALHCPRCGSLNHVPRARQGGTTPGRTEEPITSYQRTTFGWESFQCSCGHTIHLSPTFEAPIVTCPRCKTRIEVAALTP